MKIVFKIISYLEGISSVLLIIVGVFMKYVMDNPILVKTLGMPHGIFFMAYIVLAFYVKPIFKWDTKTFLIVLAAAIIPFGTFYVDRKYC